MRALTTLVSSVLVLGNAFAGSNDYFVHTEAYTPPSQYQPAHITVGWLEGEEMVQPDDACGVRFEGDFMLEWSSLDGSISQNFPADDAIADVWLPSKDCSAWHGVTVETDDDGQATPPYDSSGFIETTASMYWINSDGQKIRYLHQPCSPMPACMDNPDEESLGNGSEGLGGSIIALRRAVAMLDLSLIDQAVDALAVATRTIGEHVTYRRTVYTGSLEASLQQLEDAAVRQLSDAGEHLQICRQAVMTGKLPAARRSCELSLRRALEAQAALATGDAWIE